MESGGKNMKKLFLYIFVALAVAFVARAGYFMYCNATYQPQDGDVIFHVSESSQSTAIKVVRFRGIHIVALSL